jgi:hypothetical protein
VTKNDVPPGKSPRLSSLFVYKKKRSKVVDPLVAGSAAKKLRLVVGGNDFDASAQLIVNGTALALDGMTATELIGRLTNELLAVPAELTVQVRNSDGKLSNALKLIVSP